MLLTFYLIITNLLHGFKLLAKSAADFFFFYRKETSNSHITFKKLHQDNSFISSVPGNVHSSKVLWATYVQF